MKSSSNWTYLSDIDLFYSDSPAESPDEVILLGDEHHHVSRVMKYGVGDSLFVCNGKGTVYAGEIIDSGKTETTVRIKETYFEQKKFPRIKFALPVLKSSDRLEFAVEKLIEFGFTEFLFYKAEKAIRQTLQMSRMEKIALHAMKQSLHAHLPNLSFAGTIRDLQYSNAELIVFEKDATTELSSVTLLADAQYTFVIGPEGGFSDKELASFLPQNQFKLANQRFRSETAAIYAAALITTLV